MKFVALLLLTALVVIALSEARHRHRGKKIGLGHRGKKHRDHGKKHRDGILSRLGDQAGNAVGSFLDHGFDALLRGEEQYGQGEEYYEYE